MFTVLEFQIWSFPNCFLFLVLTMISAVLLKYLLNLSTMWLYIVCSYLATILLISIVIVIITLKFSRRAAFATPETVRAEKMLLYHTTFVTVWMILAQIGDICREYFWQLDDTPDWVDLAMRNFIDLCYLVANSGSLLFLFSLSTSLRKEFYKTFKFLQWFKSRKNLASNSITTIF